MQRHAASSGAPFSLPGRFRAVVFDMDGLLLDSEEAWHQAERDLLASHGSELTEADRIASVGRSVDDVILWYADRVGWPHERAPELRDELMRRVRERYAEIAPMPGARELVARLRGRVRLGLASNTDRPLVDHALAATGLADAFDAVVTAEEVALAKPAPDLYLLACRRLGVPPDEAVALEDSETGVRAAKAAGMTCIAIPQVDGLDVSAADQIVDSLERLLEP
jgi:HAD superfamily hydrolase (TIGR01509 family)